ncbi:hypothetical protein K3495_g879 [Podosphaera aphanis]|nr:hypothetical protein K3495_g879 [Podosphaera aphanis]
MAGVGGKTKKNHGETNQAAMSKTTTDLVTAAAAAIVCAEHSLGIKMDDLKKVGSLIFKVRAFMAKTETVKVWVLDQEQQWD